MRAFPVRPPSRVRAASCSAGPDHTCCCRPKSRARQTRPSTVRTPGSVCGSVATRSPREGRADRALLLPTINDGHRVGRYKLVRLIKNTQIYFTAPRSAPTGARQPGICCGPRGTHTRGATSAPSARTHTGCQLYFSVTQLAPSEISELMKHIGRLTGSGGGTGIRLGDFGRPPKFWTCHPKPRNHRAILACVCSQGSP